MCLAAVIIGKTVAAMAVQWNCTRLKIIAKTVARQAAPRLVVVGALLKIIPLVLVEVIVVSIIAVGRNRRLRYHANIVGCTNWALVEVEVGQIANCFVRACASNFRSTASRHCCNCKLHNGKGEGVESPV